jgi:two-component system OmpR family response regulator
MAHVLIVDDDIQLRTLTGDYMRRYGLRVTELATGRELKRALRSDNLACEPSQHSFDLLLLDLMLPDTNGLDLCRWVRDVAPLPVIMLTAQGDPASRVVGLELGADDYLAKPFEPRELVARIHAVLRRPVGRSALERTSPTDAAEQQYFEGWTFDRLGYWLRSPQQVIVKLSSAEFRLLCAFVDRPKRVLSRTRLIELARAPGANANGRAIDLAVSRLRQKLAGGPGAPGIIRTVRREGYIFDAAVEASW